MKLDVGCYHFFNLKQQLIQAIKSCYYYIFITIQLQVYKSILLLSKSSNA